MSSENISKLQQNANDLSIVTSTIFQLGTPGEYSEKYHYSRYGNPTRDLLENSLASVEGARFAVSFTSKTAAALAVLSVLKAGDSVCFSDSLTCKRLGRLVSFLKCDDVDFSSKQTFKDLSKSKTEMVWIESPTNPLLTVLDIKAIADAVHERTDAILVVDNTLMTSHLQRPLELSADVSIYSLNEYVGGHDDLNMGAAVMNDEKIYEKLRSFQYSSGVVPSPYDCYMVTRSLKTLSLRMEKHSKNSLAVASYLESHVKIEKVFHPSLKSHKNHEVALKQSYGHSGIMSFYIKGSFEQTKTFYSSLKLILISESLGGVESNASFPWMMSHAEMSEELRLAAGITQNLIQLSVGLGSSDKIIEDLKKALEKV